MFSIVLFFISLPLPPPLPPPALPPATLPPSASPSSVFKSECLVSGSLCQIEPNLFLATRSFCFSFYTRDAIEARDVYPSRRYPLTLSSPSIRSSRPFKRLEID